MKNVLAKLKEARGLIKNSDLKKKGRNDFSKFDYYTPEQVELLVDDACEKTNSIVLCNLKADEYGLFQTLKFIDIDTLEELDFEMRTKHGSITATNESQQMGGTDTYSERYIKMKVFQIKDNNLDCDANSGKPKNNIGKEIKNIEKKIVKTKKQKDWERMKEIIRQLDPIAEKDSDFKEYAEKVSKLELNEKNSTEILERLEATLELTK